MADEPAWRAVGGGLTVTVRLTPRGGRDALDGLAQLSDGRRVVAARVRAVPEAGAANAALLTLIADALGVARRDVELVAGATGRLKTLHVTGDPAALAAALSKATETA
ncbi:DUF167 family protein [Blastochloris sulfoviridis]|uniref:UPF0235 protein F1193_01215 n=1 Tax=Blastochloris sulfoviridis TaxID=50712 RepID=A0A5M6I502_9HYPH|nr:DUF167 family protein [Blastochloris sulfoviridis]KAA5603300.1 DUF167 domain-containing protein [Blastochloris sulfoviridis]